MKPNEDRISELIYKSISRTISQKEELILENWLKIPENKNLYEKIIDDENIAKKMLLYTNIETERSFRKIETDLKSKPKVRYLNLLKYAAIFIGVLTTIYFYQQNTTTISKESLEIVNADIVLQIDNTISRVIEEKNTTEFKDNEGNTFGFQNGNQLTYTNKVAKKKLVYNTIKVPFGKKFNLVLSDGTKVNLNSGTSLRYPVNFITGKDRKVFLKGEAFFDVAHDKKHPFIVNTDKIDVQVLGTRFNVSSYLDDASTDVTLVEGSVELDITTNTTKPNTNPVILKPGYKGSLGVSNSKINIQKVNTNIYTSWIRGDLVLRNLPFKQITKKLERYYNVSIKNENKALGQEVFNASFKNQSIENILIYFSETHQIDYKIQNNEIIIK